MAMFFVRRTTPPFRRAVSAAAGGPLDPFDARDGDHRSTLAGDPILSEHLTDHVLRHEERAGEVHGYDPVATRVASRR